MKNHWFIDSDNGFHFLLIIDTDTVYHDSMSHGIVDQKL